MRASRRHLVGRLLGVALATLLTPHETHAQDLITFSAAIGGVWRIYAVSGADEPRELLAGEEEQTGGSINRSKTKVLILENRRKLVAAPLREGEKRVVDLGAGSYAHPEWTGEDAVVLTSYRSTAEEETSTLVRVRLSTGAVEPLVNQTGVLDFPRLAPDGRSLTYSVGGTVSLYRAGVQVVQQLWLIDLRTGRARQLLRGHAQHIHPAWSPDGRHIAFASNEAGTFEIWITDPDGSSRRRLTDGPGAKTWPAWSPDGRTILFALARDGRQSLRMIGVNGSGERPFEPFGPDSDIELRDGHWR